MKRVGIYVRVSTDEQKKYGFSVDAQEQALKDFCKENNYRIVDIYNDAGISAHKSYKKRPELLRLIKDCQEHKIDLILFTKLDRWFRSVADYYEVQKILDDCEVPWKAIQEDYETETSSGRFKVNIMLSVAQSEAERTSERIKQTNEYKKSIGHICTGGVALGYKIVEKRWKKDEKLSKYIHIFFESYLTTFSIASATKTCDEAGYHFSSKMTYRFLRNPCYYAGVYYVPEEEAYITKEQHEVIEKHLRKRTRNGKHPSKFNGLLVCTHCGGKLTSVTSKRCNADSKIMYICARHNTDRFCCPGASINNNYLEQYLLDRMDGLLSDFKLTLESDMKQVEYKNVIQNNKSRLARLRNLYEMGDISLDEYKNKKEILTNEIEEAEKHTAIKDIPTMPNNWREVYKDLDSDHQKAFWSNVIESIEVTGRQCKDPIVKFTH